MTEKSKAKDSLFSYLCPMLLAKNLKYQYPNQTSIRFPDVICDRNERLLILGPSGCGKTTLLHSLGGLRKPNSGSVELDGTSLSSLSTTALDKFRGKNIGIVFQQSHFINALKVDENLLLAQELAGNRKDISKVRSILDALNLSHKYRSYPSDLSQGEKQRVAIARAIVNNPAMILADEPTSALDDENCIEVLKLLETQARENNAALLIVTHDGRLKDHFKNQLLLSPQNSQG